MENYRKNFLRTNKYQKRIVIIPFISTLSLCLLITLYVIFFHRKIIDATIVSSPKVSTEFINNIVTYILFYIWIFFILIMLWTLSVSSNLLGAFVRIIRELDNVIEGKEVKKIHARKEDLLANDLLIRINKLVDKIADLQGRLDLKNTSHKRPII